MVRKVFSNTAAATRLDGALSTGVYSFDVEDGSTYPSSNFVIEVNDEAMLVGSRSGNTFSSVTRGYDNTTEAAHGNLDVVRHVVVAEDFDSRFMALPAEVPTAGDDGKVYAYDETNDEWDLVANAGGGVSDLPDLGDVTIDAVADGEVLVYDGATPMWRNETLAEAGISPTGHAHAHADTTGRTANDHHNEDHQARHQSGGADALSGDVDANARVNVRKNSGADVGERRRLNFIEGSNVTLTIADDSGNEEVDITITAGGGSPLTTKGDLYGYDTSDARIPVGTNDYVLTADSTAALGVAWKENAPSGYSRSFLLMGG